MRTEPCSFPVLVCPTRAGPPVAHPSSRLPRHALPRVRHVVLALVATKDDPEQRVIPVGDSPLPDLVRNVPAVLGVEVHVPTSLGRIRRGQGKPPPPPAPKHRRDPPTAPHPP